MADQYTFPGMKQFLDAASAELDPSVRDSGRNIWHVKQVGDILAQAGNAVGEERGKRIEKAKAYRNALAAALAAVDAAMTEVGGDIRVESARDVAAKAGMAVPEPDAIATDKAAAKEVEDAREAAVPTAEEVKAATEPKPAPKADDKIGKRHESK